MIHATVHSTTYDIELTEKGKAAIVNGNSVAPDVLHTGASTMHILLNNQSYSVEIVELNRESKEVTVKVNGTNYPVQLKDRFDDLLKSLGMESAGVKRLKDVKAPMPGLVLNMLVATGERVEKETPLVILEAMKMENVIKSPTSGIIKRIGVNKGQAVEKNTILIEFE